MPCLKRILFLIAIVCCFINAKAQIGDPRSVLSIGGSGGISMSSIAFDPTIKQGQLIQPTFGFTFRYTCEKYFTTLCAFQAEVNYIKLGWKEEIVSSTSEELPDTYERSLSYVQIPILARMAWGRENRGLMFFLLMGPQVGFYMGQSAKQSEQWTLNYAGNPDRPNNVYQQYSLDPQNKFDYGLTGGIGVELNTAIGHFMVEGRYYFGLGDTFKNSKKDPFSRSAHRSIIIKGSYLFDLKK